MVESGQFMSVRGATERFFGTPHSLGLATATSALALNLPHFRDERPPLALRIRLAAGSQQVNVFRVRQTVVAVYHNLSP